MDSLTDLLYKIQRQYFPRWDVKHEYRIEMWNLPGARCNNKEKLIQVSDANDELAVIHEICHAVTRSGWHGEKWQNRFLKVADVSDILGNLQLAKAIRIEVKDIRKQLKRRTERRLTADHVNSEIQEAAFENPNASFEDIVSFVAREHSMFSKELLKYYPKSLKRAFDRAHQDLEAEKSLRLKSGI